MTMDELSNQLDEFGYYIYSWDSKLNHKYIWFLGKNDNMGSRVRMKKKEVLDILSEGGVDLLATYLSLEGTFGSS